MTVASGRVARISLDGTNGVSTVRNFNINDASGNQSYYSTNSGTLNGIMPGVRDCAGSFGYYGKQPPAVPGAGYASFYGWNGESITQPIIAESFSHSCDINGGGILSGTVNFKGNGTGIVRAASGSAPTDSSVPLVFSGIGCKAQWAARTNTSNTLQTLADIPDVQQWTVNGSYDLKEYNSSDTSGVKKRVQANGKADASVTFLQSSGAYINATATKMIPGTYGSLRLYTSASDFWALVYVCVKSADANYDVESGDLMGYTVGFDYTNYCPIGAGLTQTLGTGAVFPDTSTILRS